MARLFHKAGVNFVPFPVDYQVDPNAPLTLLDFLPSASALSQTCDDDFEAFALARYWVTLSLGGLRTESWGPSGLDKELSHWGN